MSNRNLYATRINSVIKQSRRIGLLNSDKATFSLAIGEPGFKTPSVIIDAMQSALQSGYTHYTDQRGLIELREAVINHFAHTYPIKLNNILITHGGSGGLSSSIMALIGDGDTVLIEDPTYSLYSDIVTLAGGSIKTFQRDENGEIDWINFDLKVKNCKLLIICQPSNPTGQVFERDDLERIAKICNFYGTIVLSDEAYREIYFDEKEIVSALSVDGLREHVVVCSTLSKEFAMTGWRIGYIIGPEEVINSASVVQRTMNGSLNTAVQYAAITAINNGASDAESMRKELERRRNIIIDILGKQKTLIFEKPRGAFYLWVGYPKQWGNSDILTKKLLEHGLRVRSGLEFGQAGKFRIRLSFADRENILLGGCKQLINIINNFN